MENNKGKEQIVSYDISLDGDMSKEKCEFLFRMKSEEEKLEWKEFGMPKTSQEKASFAKVVIAMANTNGGYIILGRAKTGEYKGIIERNLEISEVANSVNSFTIPEIKNLKVAVFDDLKGENLEGKNFAMIFVPGSDTLPHITIKDGDSVVKNMLYVRHSGQSEPASYHDYQRIIRKCVLLKQDELINHLEKSHVNEQLEEIKGMVQILLPQKEGKENIEGNQENILFLKDDDFIDKIKSERKDNGR